MLIPAGNLPTVADLESVHGRVRQLVSASPCVPSPLIAPRAWLKLECLQPTGSFKVRGAAAVLSRADRDQAIVTCSAGNHGLAAAEMARRLGRKICIVVSEGASPRKLALLRATAPELVIFGSTYDEAEAHAIDLAHERRARFLSPYNDAEVILGQASVGLEILNTFPDEVTVVCPVGGGGLAAGIGLALSRRPGCRLIGVEAARSAPMRVAIQQGGTVRIPIGDTLADGLAGNLQQDSMTVDLLSRYAAAMAVVSEREIRWAMHYLADSHGLIVEGAGTVGVAAVLAGRVDAPAAHPIVIVVSGRNVERQTWIDAVRLDAEPASD